MKRVTWEKHLKNAVSRLGPVWLGATIALSALGCGGDDDDDASTGSGGGAGTGNTAVGGSSAPGAAGKGGGTTSQPGTGGTGGSASAEDPFAGLDCSGGSVCDQQVCALKEAYDELVSACSSAGAPQDCEKYPGCVQALRTCIADACPGGQIDATAASTCVNNYVSCISG